MQEKFDKSSTTPPCIAQLCWNWHIGTRVLRGCGIIAIHLH